MDINNKTTYGQKEFSEAERTKIADRLSSKTPEKMVSSRPGKGGTKFKYLSGDAAVALANSSLGFNNWATEIKSMNKTHASEVGGTYIYQYTCIIRITLADGCYRESNGFGLGRDKLPYVSIELAQKAAYTDALKRALKLFGSVFIADLDEESQVEPSIICDKEPTSKNTAPPPQPPSNNIKPTPIPPVAIPMPKAP